MPEEAKPGEGTPSQPTDVIPKAEVEKIKSGFITELSKLREEKANLKKQIAQYETIKAFNPNDLSETEKVLYAKNQELIRKESEIADRETKSKEKERNLTAKELATKHGVGVEELLKFEDLAEMERYAKDFELDTLRKAVKTKQEPQPPRSKFETGGGAPVPPTGDVWGKSKEDFDKHLEKLRKEALLKK